MLTVVFYSPSVVYCQLSVVRCLLSVVYYLLQKLTVVRAEEVQRCFVFLDLRETAYGVVEAVVRIVIVDLTNLTYHDLSLAGFAIETMVKVLLHADTLSWMQDDSATRLHGMLYAIYAVMYLGIGKLLVLIGIIELNHQVSAASIDDVLHLGPMEVHRRLLVLLDNHNRPHRTFRCEW